MAEINIQVKKSRVYTDVFRATGYAAAKIADTGADPGRVFANEADRGLFEQFWREACQAIANEFKQFISTYSAPTDEAIDDAEVLELVLEMPSGYDTNLNTSLTNSLYSYLVNNITSKWFTIMTIQDDAAFYARQAEADANDIRAKIYYRKKPTRPTIT